VSTARRRADLAARAAAVAGGSAAERPADGPAARSAGRSAGRPPGARQPGDLATGELAPGGRASGDRAGGEPDGGSSRVPRTRPVRVTVELSPLEHKALRQWCAQTSADLDLPVVAGAEVFRALLSLMRDDPAVAEQVRTELERTGGSRRRH
jgi:hypothetical protein